ncbi:MAG: mechanosensitive ion channel family protein [Cephaloticoccus sp.]|nr:mechanosensitive ion channel family protein [Cephaloticoccus sp.]
MDDFLLTASEWLNYPLFRIGQGNVTLNGISSFIVLLLVIVMVERLIRRYVVKRVLAGTHLDESMRFGIERIIGYLIIVVGFYLAIQNTGIDLSSLAVVAGAIGVGLGFGLQNIISNFISGIIILAERPIAIGDRVEVGGVAGQVAKISLRSTTVVTNDNISIIVPNSQFISETVTNWSHGDPKVQMRISVGVAYGSDTDKVKEALLAVAQSHPKVLADPPPAVFFIEFGDSSLNFELGVWTQEMVRSPRRFRSDLNFAIDRKFREMGIEIPFPQRDLHVRSGTLTVRQETPERRAEP